MSRSRKPSPTRVPVLTEVLELGADEFLPTAPMLDAALAPVEPRREWQEAPADREVDEDAVTLAIMEDLQRQIDLMIEHRVGAALEPILRRLTESVAAEARTALALSLKDTLRLAVRQELQRVRLKGQDSRT